MEKKYNIEDVVLVYKETPTFEEGAIGQIIDRDPNDGSYAVATLQDIGKARMDIAVILKRYTKWVSSKNMKLLTFDRPKTFIQKLKSFFSLKWIKKQKIK